MVAEYQKHYAVPAGDNSAEGCFGNLKNTLRRIGGSGKGRKDHRRTIDALASSALLRQPGLEAILKAHVQYRCAGRSGKLKLSPKKFYEPTQCAWLFPSDPRHDLHSVQARASKKKGVPGKPVSRSLPRTPSLNSRVVPTYGTLGTAVSLHFTDEAFQSRLLKDAPETVPGPRSSRVGCEMASHGGGLHGAWAKTLGTGPGGATSGGAPVSIHH
eukprot:Skav206918  [mRNA]  locus=scaffold808:683885:689536:+ [translate_table: standard]